MQEAKFATVKGAYDVHCHAGKPSCDERPFTDIFVAQQAAAAGMAAWYSRATMKTPWPGHFM